MKRAMTCLFASAVVLASATSVAAATIYQVKDIRVGPFGYGLDPGNPMVDLDGRLVFFATSDRVAPNPPQPWISDGTDAGTVEIAPIGASYGNVTAYGTLASNGKVFFWYDDGSTGTELWSTDGTAAGTHRLTDMNPPFYAGPVARPDGVFFVAPTTTASYIDRLWISDGTGLGTTAVDPGEQVAAIWHVAVADETAFYDEQPGSGLVRSDGTIAGTVNMNSPPGYMLAVNERMYITPEDQSSAFHELRSALTSDTTTTPLMNVSGGSELKNLIRVDDRLFFSFNDGSKGSELWVSDGTPGGTGLVMDINPGNPGSNPVPLGAIDGTLFFMADDGVHGRELWRSNGTAAGTALVKDIQLGSAHGLPPYSAYPNAIVANKHLYFAAYDNTATLRLWISDGSTSGTHLVDAPGPALTENVFATSNGRLFMVADSGDGRELHALDLLSAPAPIWCKNIEQPLRDDGSVQSIVQLPAGTGLSVANLSVGLDLGHTYVGDLVITLTHTETANAATLVSGGESCPGQLLDIRFDDSAAATADNACAASRPAWPRDRGYRPTTPLSAFNGDDIGGHWILTVQDAAAQDSGTLHEWCLYFNDHIFANSFD